MGNYIGATHVELWNPVRSPFSSNTRPSLTQVEELILQAEVHVEATLDRAGYALPIPSTATGAFRLVQSAMAQHAAYYVERVAPATDKDRVTHYQLMAESACKMLADVPLPGLDKASTGAQSVGAGFGLYASPMFSLDMDL